MLEQNIKKHNATTSEAYNFLEMNSLSVNYGNFSSDSVSKEARGLIIKLFCVYIF